MRISDWSSDVCSSDLTRGEQPRISRQDVERIRVADRQRRLVLDLDPHDRAGRLARHSQVFGTRQSAAVRRGKGGTALDRDERAPLLHPVLQMIGALLPEIPFIGFAADPRSEEHTSELQSLMRISYA